MHNILLSGLPGTGKTTVGNYLAKSYDLRHIDMEAYSQHPDCTYVVDELLGDDDEFITRVKNSDSSVVLSWGFRPDKDSEAVQKLVDSGFRMVWLTGDNHLAYQTYRSREGRSFKAWRAYRRQLGKIARHKVLETYSPEVISVFTADGTFRSRKDIAAAILEIAEAS